MTVIISIQPLTRLRPLSQTPIDLRQLVIIGPLLDSPQYPPVPFPIAADLRPNQQADSQWKGALVLGGSTELLNRHWGDAVQFAKICTYTAATSKNPLPYVMEYLSLVDPQGHHVFYKCRKRTERHIVSYVFPEKIDFYTHSLTQNAWYQTPLISILAEMTGKVFDDWTYTADTLFDSIGDNVHAANMLAYDHYTHAISVLEINTFLNDFYRLVHSPEYQANDDVYSYWLSQAIPFLKEKDIFLRHVLMSRPMTYHDLTTWSIPSIFDLSVPAPLKSRITGAYATFPQCYLPIASIIEKLPYTDFAVTLHCTNGHLTPGKIEHAVDRFSIFHLEPLPLVDGLYSLCIQLFRLYQTYSPQTAQNTTLVRIEKSFNEEALFQFYHHDSLLDHAIHVDFALLSYCSPGLGRFFNSAANRPF